MKIIIDVNPADIDWGKSTVHKHAERGPDDAIYWDIDVDIDHCHYIVNGECKRVTFVDDDEAAQYFYEDYREDRAGADAEQTLRNALRVWGARA